MPAQLPHGRPEPFELHHLDLQVIGQMRYAAKRAKRSVHYPDIWRTAILGSADLPAVDQSMSFELSGIFKADLPLPFSG